jgi:DNA polymerase elongation subunit (family B)
MTTPTVTGRKRLRTHPTSQSLPVEEQEEAETEAGEEALGFGEEEEAPCGEEDPLGVAEEGGAGGGEATGARARSGADARSGLSREVGPLLRDLPYSWGREDQQIFYFEVNSFKSRRATTTLPGRAWFDSLTWCRKDVSTDPSYKLKHLAEQYMTDTDAAEFKQDLHWTQILPKFRGDDESRAELASYCLQDCVCCVHLMQKRLAFVKSFAGARGSYMTFARYFAATAQAQDYTTIVALGLREQVFVPWCLSPVMEKAGGYIGGKVFDVEKGFWPQYVFTLDATSLYPTTMIAHHLCATNYVAPARRDQYPPEMLEACPEGHTYLRREGIGGKLLRNGIRNRNAYKAKCKEAKGRGDMAAASAYDSAQLVEKLKINTWYGMMGAKVSMGGLLPFAPAAESTTSWGRWHITRVSEMVKEHYPQIRQIGGDTDSVILAIDAAKHGLDEEGILRLGKEVTAMINKTLPEPMSFAFENVYEGLIYVARKNYAGSHKMVVGGKLAAPDSLEDAMKVRGLACVRKNFAPIIADVQWHVLRALFGLAPCSRVGCVLPPPPECLFDVCGATPRERVIMSLTYYAEQIAQDKIPIEGYAVSAELTQEEYKGRPPHSVVADKARRRNPEDAPKVGDRVVYFWTKQGGKPVPCDAVEIRARGLAIDRAKYLDAFKKVHIGTFGHVVDPDDLDARLCAIVIQPSRLAATNPFAAFLVKK